MRMLELGREAARSWCLIGALLVAACVSAKESPQAGGESHFLRRCDDDKCGAGLDCIQGVCTRGCVVDKQSCGDLASDAVCTAASVEPGEVAICDVACSATKDCSEISASHGCEAGFCRAPPTVSGGAGAGASIFPTDKVFPCPENVTTGLLTVDQAVVAGNQLRLRVTHSGGCAEHSFAVCFRSDFREEVPVGTTLSVIHDDGGDHCEAMLFKNLGFDLTPLAEHYKRSYRSEAGLIETNFGTYAFGALSCEDRSRAADAQVARFTDQAARSCTTADDCQGVSFDTRCTRGCGNVIAREWAGDFASWLAAMDREVCGDYDAAGCPPLPDFDCGELEPACVQGRCQHGLR